MPMRPVSESRSTKSATRSDTRSYFEAQSIEADHDVFGHFIAQRSIVHALVHMSEDGLSSLDLAREIDCHIEMRMRWMRTAAQTVYDEKIRSLEAFDHLRSDFAEIRRVDERFAIGFKAKSGACYRPVWHLDELKGKSRNQLSIFDILQTNQRGIAELALKYIVEPPTQPLARSGVGEAW